MKKLFTLLFLTATLFSFKGIAQNVPCTGLSVNFTSQAEANNSNVIHFTSTTVGYAVGDTIQWTFGDGSTSAELNPIHTYTTGGVKQVCLIIRKVVSPGAAPCVNYHCTTLTVELPCTLAASFTSQPSTSNSLGVYFTNTSTGFATGDSIRWSFGDGTYAYTATAYHAYANAGTYQVCLWVKKNPTSPTVQACVSEICHSVTVTAPCNLVVNFTSQQTTQPNIIQFTNTSTGYAAGDSVHWTFGDGGTSSDPNPIHTYTTGNTYSVCLTIIKHTATGTLPTCSGTICHNIAVTVPVTCNLHAAFSFQAGTTGTSATAVYFTNTSTGFATGDSIRWSFGDGSFSTELNPVHNYPVAGVYTVCLWVKKNTLSTANPCVSEICHTVVVSAPCNLTVNYTSTALAGQPNVIQFTNTSTGYAAGDTIHWDFGDGSISSTSNPLHTFINAGTYQVCLTIRKAVVAGTAACANYHCASVTVTLPCNLSASFTSQPSTSNSLGVYFTNTSTGFATGDSIRWSFGDGTYAYTPTAYHVYANAGIYNVCLRVKKNSNSATTPACVSEICHTVTVTAPCNLVVNYTSYADTLHHNIIHFTSTSTGYAVGDSVHWTFGDGTSSADLNPTHTYTTGGTYQVCLTIIHHTASGTVPCTGTSCHSITVANPCTLTANYTQHADSLNHQLIHFTNTTAPIATNYTVNWYFGDGTTATTWNADHQFAQPGTYQVCLRVQYGDCVSYHCDSVHVTQTQVPCGELANFHYLAVSATGLGAVFSPDHVYTDVTYTWTFGDGTGSHDITATHVFAITGYYTVCLTAYRNNGCAATSCTIIHLPTGSSPNCNNNTLGFVTTTNTSSLNSVTFTGSSNAPILDQVWTITKIPTTVTGGTITLHATNPTYAFSDTGTYYVCLHATFAGGCTKDYCRQIHVSFPLGGSNACSLQLYPNPATSVINVLVTLSQPAVITAVVYNNSNMQVIQKEQQGVTGPNTMNINIASLPAGVYTMRVTYGTQVCYATFIKQ